MLTTCLWSSANNALEMAEYYTSIFPESKITTQGIYNEPNEHLPGSKKGDVMIVEFSLMNVPFSTLNGGPYFKIDPSISFFMSSNNKDEISQIWEKLLDGGKTLMALDMYPWSEWYGWIEDKYGVSWQLFYTEEKLVQLIAPCLAFTKEKVGKAEEAMNYYTSVFSDSGINILARYEAEDGGIEGYIKHGQFHIGDFMMSAMDAVGPHNFDFSCAVSFMLPCKDQSELDYFYEKLSVKPESEMCGWVVDQYGISWQLIPTRFTELMSSDDSEKKGKLMKSLMQMKRLTIQEIEKAYNA